MRRFEFADLEKYASDEEGMAASLSSDEDDDSDDSGSESCGATADGSVACSSGSTCGLSAPRRRGSTDSEPYWHMMGRTGLCQP